MNFIQVRKKFTTEVTHYVPEHQVLGFIKEEDILYFSYFDSEQHIQKIQVAEYELQTVSFVKVVASA